MKNMNLFVSFVAAAFAATAFLPARAAQEPVRIVATTTDLASIARSVAGPWADVTSITTGHEDPHTLTARPSSILRARDADFWIRVGMELEVGWEPVILRESRNTKIRVGSPNHLDASLAVRRLEVPEARVTRDLGDVHPEGNPHYWLDPLNGRLVAAAIAERLSAVYPEHRAEIAANLARFEHDLDARMFGAKLVDRFGGEALWRAETSGRLDALLRAKGAAGDLGGWRARLAPHCGATVVTYHRSWSYLADRFGLKADLQLEPKPGIPPTAAHLAELVTAMKARGAKVLLQEPFYPRRAADWVAERTGAKVIVVPLMTGGSSAAADYLATIENAVAALEGAL